MIFLFFKCVLFNIYHYIVLSPEVIDYILHFFGGRDTKKVENDAMK